MLLLKRFFWLVFCFAFFLQRLILLFVYFDYFGVLSFWEILASFLNGLRFDLNVIFTFLAPVILLLNLPFGFVKNRILNILVGIFASLVMLGFVLILVGDLFYFAEVSRHIGDEIITIRGEEGYLLEFILANWLYFGLAFLVLLGLVFSSFKISSAKFRLNSYKYWTFLGVILLSFALIRGSVDTKPITIANAFVGKKQELGVLSLNGVFTSYVVMRRMDANKKDNFLYSKQDALQTWGLKDIDYPLKKRYDNNNTRLNVVVLLLESWNIRQIGYLTPKMLTPNFESLANVGIKFTNFYASGQRSIEGIGATLTGLMPIANVPSLGFGLENSKLTRLGEILRKNNYQSIMAQTSKRNSYYVDLISNYLGFDKFFGNEDMPIILDYPKGLKPHFGYDYEGFMKLLSEIDKLDKNFFAFLFTGTTHTPFVRLPKNLEPFEYDGTNGNNAFLNTLFYSDWALGEFMKLAKTKPWFDDTVFILLADHTRLESNYETAFKIPCVIYSPKHIAPRVDDKIYSQSQIMPTIIDILGFSNDFYAFYDSVFKQSLDAAFGYSATSIGAFNKNGFVELSEGKIAQSTMDKNQSLFWAKKIQTSQQILKELFNTNHLAK